MTQQNNAPDQNNQPKPATPDAVPGNAPGQAPAKQDDSKSPGAPVVNPIKT
jgi:hypothetical protein